MNRSSLLRHQRKKGADVFLAEMDRAIPRGKFLGLICPKYYQKKDKRGRKLHVGTDAKSQLIHTVQTGAAKVHARFLMLVLQGKEQVVFGDKAYANKEKKKKWRKTGKCWGRKRQQERKTIAMVFLSSFPHGILPLS